MENAELDLQKERRRSLSGNGENGETNEVSFISVCLIFAAVKSLHLAWLCLHFYDLQ